MIPPLLLRAATHPGLFADHLGAYAELAGAEAGVLGQRWLRCGALALGALVSGSLALGLAGVATLLVASVPLELMRAPWALWALPLLCAVISALCAWGVRASATAHSAFPLLRRQLEADAQLLREVNAA